MPAPIPQPKTLYDKIWADHVMWVAKYGTTPSRLSTHRPRQRTNVATSTRMDWHSSTSTGKSLYIPKRSGADRSAPDVQAPSTRGLEPAGFRGIVRRETLDIASKLAYPDHCIFRRNAGRPVRRPDLTLATVDHNIP